MTRRQLTDHEKLCANNLRRIWARKKRELALTQEEASHRLGWRSQSTVGQYLNGRIPLNTDAKIKFANLLQVDISEIDPKLTNETQISQEDEILMLTGAEEELIHEFRRKTPKGKELILNVAVSVANSRKAQKQSD